MRSKFLLITFIMIIVAAGVCAQKAVDYLGVPGPVKINNASYLLTWSSHPSATYYKQEYLASGDNPEQFATMVLLEALVTNSTPKEIAAGKISELEQMKASNPVVNYNVMQKDEEIMIDFLLSENTADGKLLKILERNVYRYKAFTDKNGKKGILLLGVSERRYGDDITPYLQNLKSTKNTLVNAVGAFTMPQIIISNK